MSLLMVLVRFTSRPHDDNSDPQTFRGAGRWTGFLWADAGQDSIARAGEAAARLQTRDGHRLARLQVLTRELSSHRRASAGRRDRRGGPGMVFCQWTKTK